MGRLGLLLVVSIGIAATTFWLSASGGPDYARLDPASVAIGLLFTTGLTTSNLALRWCRWHYLLRRARFALQARDSLVAYVVTLPSLLTPFYLGELLRGVLFRRRHPGIGPWIALVWLVERSCDITVLVAFHALATGHGFRAASASAAWLVSFALARHALSNRARARVLALRTLLLVLAATVAAWVLPVLAFWGLFRQLGATIPPEVAFASFSRGTFLGSFTGLPLGVGVTGSLLIVELQDLGVELPVAIVATALFRAGTAWFAVALGTACLLFSKRHVVSLLSPAPAGCHFDAIAEAYPDALPEHVQGRLLPRKVDLMRRWLSHEGISPPSRGLDLGCGQGWHASEMATLGYRMSGIDRSREQVVAARAHATESQVAVEFEVGNAASLPYADGSFDFVYAINAIHHLADERAQRSALEEIVRVLRPGGVFLLHEINTRNPLFRFYMGYVFPVVRNIDEGTESWIVPTRLPVVAAGRWMPEIDYFTFLPDFLSAGLQRALEPLEGALERSGIRHWSAHYLARLRKHG